MLCIDVLQRWGHVVTCIIDSAVLAAELWLNITATLQRFAVSSIAVLRLQCTKRRLPCGIPAAV